ncbi:hypothetical protein DPMN_165938 [Dreissena polymorpha]|uniref:Uncharacterized protein n=1 Tax=Dreissena polymorpha TaxID=45954 RepID=A0A9D4EVX2_DREPO|nr:hypothetical protein DPMN_165938 [Dreissena polymorpha]
MLDGKTGWSMKDDLDKKLVLSHIVHTNLMPDNGTLVNHVQGGLRGEPAFLVVPHRSRR